MADKKNVGNDKDAKTKPGRKRVEKKIDAAPSSIRRKESFKDRKNESNDFRDNDKKGSGNNKDGNTLKSLLINIGIVIIIIFAAISKFDAAENKSALDFLDIFLKGGNVESLCNMSSVEPFAWGKLEKEHIVTAEDIIFKIQEEKIKAKKNDFNFEENLYIDTKSSKFKIYQTENFRSKVGIDVSYYQKNIDWKKVKAAGVDFAIIRIGFRGYTTGKIMPDEDFQKNIEGALDAGIHVGVYFFTQAVNKKEAEEEADYVIKNIKKYNITYPVVIDTEETNDKKNARSSSSKIDKETLTDICIAFCERVEKAGYTSSIYASKSWFYSQLDMERLEKYDKWLANYAAYPEFPFEFAMWQYEDKGKVDGISGNVDLNMTLKDYSN